MVQRVVLLVLVPALLAGCRRAQESGTLPAAMIPSASPTAGATPSAPPLASVTAETTADASRDAALNFARQDLAERLQVEQDAIELASLEAVDWPDTGLGCPAPGEHVLMVTVPGYRIRLAHAGQSYEYHSGGTIRPRLCSAQPAAQGLVPVAPGDTIELVGELVSIGNMPFSRLAISLESGETFEVRPSELASATAGEPRERKAWRVRVVGRGLLTPIEVEILAERP